MKAHVEWGKPKAACNNRPCGVSGQFTAENPTQADKLARNLFHTMTEGREPVATKDPAWSVDQSCPRKVRWSADRTCWVAVTLIDGVARGAYGGIADREAGAPCN